MKFILFILFLVNCKTAEQKEMSPEMSVRYSSSRDSSIKESGSASNIQNPLEPKKINTLSQRKLIIYNANVNIKTDSVQKTIEKIQTETEKIQGIVLKMNSYGNMIIKVPSEKLKPFLLNLKNSSKEYTEEISSQDVTEEFIDIGIQLDNLRKIRETYLGILKTAKNVEEILKVQAELNRVSDSIDRLEGRTRYLTDKTDYSTITINIYSENRAIVVKEKEYKPGILGYPFYYLYKGLGYTYDGLVWLFIQEKEEK